MVTINDLTWLAVITGDVRLMEEVKMAEDVNDLLAAEHRKFLTEMRERFMKVRESGLLISSCDSTWYEIPWYEIRYLFEEIDDLHAQVGLRESVIRDLIAHRYHTGGCAYHTPDHIGRHGVCDCGANDTFKRAEQI